MNSSIQDCLPDNPCFGCGADNRHGHRIKSYWQDNGAVCTFTPEPWHCAGSPQVVYGGLIASIFDCHGVCTAIADAYRRAGREIGEGDVMFYVTGNLNVDFLRPAPIGEPIELTSHIESVEGNKTLVSCVARVNSQDCARAGVLAIKVAPDWKPRGSHA